MKVFVWLFVFVTILKSQTSIDLHYIELLFHDRPSHSNRVIGHYIPIKNVKTFPSKQSKRKQRKLFTILNSENLSTRGGQYRFMRALNKYKLIRIFEKLDLKSNIEKKITTEYNDEKISLTIKKIFSEGKYINFDRLSFIGYVGMRKLFNDIWFISEKEISKEDEQYQLTQLINYIDNFPDSN